ncbi:DUF1178 family protein [Tateyamaria sp.]|uniref:DUF1178 family protein n=1 Tax=Tateyamaria sp. TaxID=1929288 RepID=UPI00329FA90C
MIKYTLKCDDGHAFESWFANADAYDSLLSAGHVSCAVCGSTQVRKAIMAPRVNTTKERPPEAEATQPAVPETSEAQAALAQMREDVEKNATYVGGDFARKARDMHLGDAPDTPIWGEANLKDAKALIDDGVPVAPLPFIPTRKVN